MYHYPFVAQARSVARAAAAALAAFAFGAAATEIVYRPVNPSFGGDPANGAVLLNSANAQNNKTDPKAVDLSSGGAAAQQTPLQQFNDTLQRSILSRIASSVSGGIFNASGQLIPGVVDTANFRITITDLGGGMLQISTLDKSNGQSTSFQVSQ
jgi:curli production assembly/transport component CsgF